MSRNDRSPIPRSAHCFTTASSNSWRRARSGARATDAPLLASSLEPFCLEIQVAPCYSTHEQTHQRAQRSTLIELLTHLGARLGLRLDLVARHRDAAGRALHPGPRRPG